MNLSNFYLNGLRISIGVIYVWFGMLKFFPHLSPAEELSEKTISIITFQLFTGVLAVKLLAALEVAIGILLLVNWQLKIAISIMLFHMLCTLTPAFVLPELFFTKPPYGLTLVGQYIIKNLVFIFGALLIYNQQKNI
ncbi:MAG: hypothetical protein WBO76_03005 [Saprospiraceae bacterium]